VIRSFEEIKRVRWLIGVAEQCPGFRPVLVEEGSTWKAPVAGALLGSGSLVLLERGALRGEALPLSDIVLAKLIEDSHERYTVELRPRGQGATVATLVFGDDLYFLLLFAALTNATVQCEFGFTRQRLMELGATEGATPQLVT
jgi:hypothetical protein